MYNTIDLSIVTYNSSRWLQKFFTSLCQQHYPLQHLNIFILDNGSTDDTYTQCQRFQQSLGSQFGHFDLVQGPNIGFGRGHNQNFQRGKADYFLVTNVDLEFEPESLQEIMQVAVQEQNPKVASFEFRQKPYEHPKYYNPVSQETRWSSSACVLFKRSAFAAVGGYEEKIFLYGEDVEISYRLRDHGYSLKYCPRAVCWHHSYETAQQVKPAQYFGSAMSNVYLRLRYGSWWEIISGYLLYLTLFLRRSPVKNRYRQLVKNLLTIIKKTPYFLRSRKKSTIRFIFSWFDYDLRRGGDFYPCANLAKLPNLPLISVIIRTYQDRLEWLKQAVTSVLNQTYPHIELIIVEDGSTNAKAYCEDLQQSSHLSNIIYQDIPKGGRCLAGNKGMELATGDFIIFLDDDDLFFADHLETLANELIQHPEVGATYSSAFQVSTRIQSTIPLVYLETHFELIHQQPFSRTILWFRNYLAIQSVLFRRALYIKYGGFDTDLEALEDWNLWTRFSVESPFLFINKVTSLYRVPDSVAVNIKRQMFIDDYYAKAREKQAAISIPQLSITEIKGMMKTINKEQRLLKIKRGWPRKLVLQHATLYTIYQRIIRLKPILKKLSTHNG